MVQEALGMIETKGFCALLEAADSALKAANVTMTGYEAVGSGYVAAFFRGERGGSQGPPSTRAPKRPRASAKSSACRSFRDRTKTRPARSLVAGSS